MQRLAYAEIERVRQTVIVALGATAIRALSGERVKVGYARSLRIAHGSGVRVVATHHPSAVLRAPDERERERMRASLVADLAKALDEV